MTERGDEMDQGSDDERAELFNRILEERNELLREKAAHRSFVSYLIGDKGHRTQGIVTLAFVVFLIAGLFGLIR